ncbi:MAG: hypothetical protein SOI44_05590 [Lactimicrobium sp.]|uniref:hypothetical protein n=1 Tax=Lactimicrobium sp. TaxID=2563780 RepID=UPI002F34F76B
MDNQSVKTKVFSVLLGIGTGLGMAVVVLFGMIRSEYAFWTLPFFLTVVIGMMLPGVLDTIDKKGMIPWLAESVMCAVSFVICVGYSFAVTRSVAASNMQAQIVLYALIVHSCALLRILIQNRKK